LRNQLPKRKKEAKAINEALQTNPLIGSAKAKELLSEADFSDAVSPSVIENTTRHLGDKVQR
jgi:hypothetical protein